MRNTIAILGVPVDDLDTAQVLERIEEMVASGRFHQVATANTDFVVRAMQDPELRSILRTADMVVPDGMPIVLASRWLGAPLKERVAGADLVPMLCDLACRKGWRLFVVGARPEVARIARARLESAYPGIQIAGWISPPNTHIVRMDNETILSEIERTRPDILLVAFGNPKQEKWIHMHRRRLKVPVCIGVGGSFDFIAGATKRAPAWMQRAGLEWFHRLTHEPRRLWRRYFGDFVHFGRFLAWQLWVLRRRRRGASQLTEAKVGDCTVLAVSGALSGALLERFRAAAQTAIDAPSHLVLDLEHTTALDSQALGTLLNLPRRAAHVGREVRVCGARGKALRALLLAGAQECARMTPSLADALSGVPAPELKSQIVREPAGAVLRLEGPASVTTLDVLRAALSSVAGGPGPVTVDLSALTYVDCAAVTELKAAADNTVGTAEGIAVRSGPALEAFLRRENLVGLFDQTRRPSAA